MLDGDTIVNVQNDSPVMFTLKNTDYDIIYIVAPLKK